MHTCPDGLLGELMNIKYFFCLSFLIISSISLACGSGACASVYAAWKKKLTNNKAEVILEKGSLLINIDNEKAIMTGPAEISYHGNLEI